MAGKEMSEAEVLAELDKDVIFYEQSGGGVSFSGGEPLLQHEFLTSLLKACKGKGFHTTVDTTGLASPEVLSRVADFTDLFLFDLKTIDDEKHREYTGVSNGLILSNLARLAEWKKHVIVRIPVVPGVNDDLDSIKQAGAFVASLGNVTEIHLLPYHTIGLEKYRRLGMENDMQQTLPPSADDLSSIVKELRTYVSTVSIGG
jgi:pyruvate formate lyase activating enzyme